MSKIMFDRLINTTSKIEDSLKTKTQNIPYVDMVYLDPDGISTNYTDSNSYTSKQKHPHVNLKKISFI